MPLHDTYAAALQRDLTDLPAGTRLVGVVRRPTRWFSPVVDRNLPALGPPESLLEAFQRRRDDMKMQGLCEEGAHNAAWDEVDFERRYRAHLEDDPAAEAALAELADLLAAGEDVALVCYENTNKKRCHRTVLRNVLEASSADAPMTED